MCDPFVISMQKEAVLQYQSRSREILPHSVLQPRGVKRHNKSCEALEVCIRPILDARE